MAQSTLPQRTVPLSAPPQSTPPQSTVPESDEVHPLERRGRWWIFGSFVLCPCHLPITLAVLATLLGSTAAGAFLRDNLLLAGIVVTAGWVAGTWRGFHLVRQAKQGACPVPQDR